MDGDGRPPGRQPNNKYALFDAGTKNVVTPRTPRGNAAGALPQQRGTAAENRFSLFGADGKLVSKPREHRPAAETWRASDRAGTTGAGSGDGTSPAGMAVPHGYPGSRPPRGSAGLAPYGEPGGDQWPPERITSTSGTGRYGSEHSLEGVTIVSERSEARSAEWEKHKGLAILQCDAEGSADDVFNPLASVLADKLGFGQWGKYWIGKHKQAKKQANDLKYWLDWFVEGLKQGQELFLYVYSEDEDCLNLEGDGNVHLSKQLTEHIKKVHEKGEISLHILVDGAEGAHLPWRLQCSSGESATTVTWKHTNKKFFATNKSKSTSTIVQICTNHAHLPGLMTGAFVTMMKQEQFISYIQLYRTMDVLLNDLDATVDDPNREFSERSLKSRSRAIDPISLAILGGVASGIGKLAAWQIQRVMKKKRVQKEKQLMKAGLVFSSADFIDEDMSLLFRDWKGDGCPVWTDKGESEDIPPREGQDSKLDVGLHVGHGSQPPAASMAPQASPRPLWHGGYQPGQHNASPQYQAEQHEAPAMSALREPPGAGQAPVPPHPGLPQYGQWQQPSPRGPPLNLGGHNGAGAGQPHFAGPLQPHYGGFLPPAQAQYFVGSNPGHPGAPNAGGAHGNLLQPSPRWHDPRAVQVHGVGGCSPYGNPPTPP